MGVRAHPGVVVAFELTWIFLGLLGDLEQVLLVLGHLDLLALLEFIELTTIM